MFHRNKKPVQRFYFVLELENMAMLFFEIVLKASKFSFSHCVKQAEIRPIRLNFMAYFMCSGIDES